MATFPAPAIVELPDDLRTRILAVQEKAGFVPNVFARLAYRPAELRAFMDYHDALMLRDSPTLSKAEREMIVVATSARNQCLYCVVAHGALVRVYSKDPQLADHLATNYRKAAISPRQRAMLDFALQVCSASETCSEADHAALEAHHFSADDIWDIAAITAFFGMSNRMANFAGMLPNAEFYLLGRVPRVKATA